MYESSTQGDQGMPKSWLLAFERILRDPGIVLVVGAPDSGKSTFCRSLAQAAVRSGLCVAYVDADIGQSTVGPPGCIGWAAVSGEGRLKERGLWFIGAYSPAGHLPEMITGTRAMVGQAKRWGAELVVVDTTGLVRGWMGFQLKIAKAQLVRPKHLALFAGAREMGPLPFALSTLRGVRIHRLRVPDEIRKRDISERRAYRAERLRAFLSEATEMTYPFPDLFLWGRSWYRPGRHLTQEEQAELERRFQVSLVHAEQRSGITFVVRAAQELQRYAESRSYQPRIRMRFLPVESWRGRLCALEQEPGEVLALGKLVSLNFKNRTLQLLGKRVAKGRARIMKIGPEILPI